MVLDLFGRVARGIRKDNCGGYAAEIAFFFLFALFPCLLSLTSLLAYLPVPDLSQILLRNMDSLSPLPFLPWWKKISMPWSRCKREEFSLSGSC